MKDVLTMGATIAGAIALLVAEFAWSGYALSILWAWFIVPTFALPALSVPAAIGVALVMGYMTKSGPRRKPEDEDESQATSLLRDLLWSFVKPAVALLIGWVTQHFL